MKAKNVFRIIFFTILILFTTLYMTQALGYYEYSAKKTNRLTEDAVRKFEQDLKEGKEVNASDYIKKENDYSNRLSKLGITASNIVGDTFDNLMNFIFNELAKNVEK